MLTGLEPSPLRREHEPMTNPLLAPSQLPYDLPDFAVIKDEHYLPAFEAAMAQHREEVEEILGNEAQPTIDNTLIALERAGRTLERVAAAFFNQASSHATEAIKAVEEEIVPKLTAHQDAKIGRASCRERV